MSALSAIIETLVLNYDLSDIHLKEGSSPWVRVNGALTLVKGKQLSKTEIRDFFKQYEAATGIPASKIEQLLEDKGDLDFAVKVGSRKFRGNLFFANGKLLGVALRLMPDEIPRFASLGLPATVQTMLQQSKGLILVTGSTGSGKTTTLASALDYINEYRKGHIITLEDPVEYSIKSKSCLVDQRQVGRDMKNFQVGLRAALRQGPDVLLVGELRDNDTVKTALDAANTGHLVLATLHTNSAQQSIERLTSFFSADKKEWACATISQVLIGIVSQALIPRASGEGRVLAAEVLVATPEVKTAIRESRTHQILNAMDTGSSKGQLLLNSVLKDLVKRGTITKDAALYYTYNHTQLLKELANA